MWGGCVRGAVCVLVGGGCCVCVIWCLGCVCDCLLDSLARVSRCRQSKWTKGSILTKIIGTYKSEMPGNGAGNYVTLHEFHSLLICNGVK